MKKVILRSLTLTNWRGERSRTTNFDPISTTIAGGNGLGKSRHFDAFMWLLFGKDSQDRKDFNVKSIVDGQPLMKTECEVVGVLDVDGEKITLRRAFVEEWVKPRGQVEQVFKGNKTECYWNDTPVSVTEYQKRVNAIIDDSVFKMVTNPLFFASMPWKNQREQLFQLAGTVTDHEIASSKPEFSVLLDKISGKSFSDFKSELVARKKRLKADLSEIQPRIDQTQRLMPEMTDFATLEEEVARIEAEIEKVDKAMNDATERVRQQYEAVQERQSKINALKRQRQQVLFDAQSKAKEDAFNANSNRRETEAKVKDVERNSESLKREVQSYEEEKARLEKDVANLVSKSDALREEWYKENDTTYNGETKCSCCGQELPDAMKAEALEHFNKHKQSQLDEITSKGKGYKEQIEILNSRIQKLEVDLVASTDKYNASKEELELLRKEFESLSEVKQAEVNPENIKEYSDLTKQISDLEDGLKAYESQIQTDSTEAYQERKKELSANRDEVKARLANREHIERFKKQIADLEAKGKDIAQQIANIEREEYTVQQFTKAKIDECEKRINGLFTMVTFRLFEYTIEDTKKENPIETCVPFVDGVPFTVANTASQVNGGLDIINTLCKFYGVNAPIFIDNAESTNHLIETDAQMIKLVVSKDKTLRIEYGKMEAD